jgi:hypothetical protein
VDPYTLLAPTPLVEMKETELDEAERCPNFRYVVMTVLEIGNYLNTGTRNKNAVGYKLETLLKTGDTKSPFRKGLTLLFYIALHCMKTKPSALDFPKEFEPVGEAFAYPYDMLTGDVAKIIKDVKGMEKFAKEAAECKDPADKWEEQVGDFSKRMSAKVVVLEKLIARLGKMSEAMCVQFAEKPSEKAADDFFTKLSKFSGMFQAGVDFLNEEEAKRKKELDKKKKAAEKERKKKEKKAAAAKKKADKEKKAKDKKEGKGGGGDKDKKEKTPRERKPKKDKGGGGGDDADAKAKKEAEREARRKKREAAKAKKAKEAEAG